MLILISFILTPQILSFYSKLSLPTENVSTYSDRKTPVLRNNAIIKITATRKAEMIGRLISTAKGIQVLGGRKHLRTAVTFEFSAKCVRLNFLSVRLTMKL